MTLTCICTNIFASILCSIEELFIFRLEMNVTMCYHFFIEGIVSWTLVDLIFNCVVIDIARQMLFQEKRTFCARCTLY
jgi:hypothetical protein